MFGKIKNLIIGIMKRKNSVPEIQKNDTAKLTLEEYKIWQKTFPGESKEMIAKRASKFYQGKEVQIPQKEYIICGRKANYYDAREA